MKTQRLDQPHFANRHPRDADKRRLTIPPKNPSPAKADDAESMQDAARFPACAQALGLTQSEFPRRIDVPPTLSQLGTRQTSPNWRSQGALKVLDRVELLCMLWADASD
jgi:hypothetical protein